VPSRGTTESDRRRTLNKEKLNEQGKWEEILRVLRKNMITLIPYKLYRGNMILTKKRKCIVQWFEVLYILF